MRAALLAVAWVLWGCGGVSEGGFSFEENPGAVTVEVDPQATRILDIMPIDRLARVAARLPALTDPALAALLESPDTLWYDRHSLVPGYQDSFGQDFDCATCGPTGMRPNTIDKSMINLAVPGGWQQVFTQKGLFHFPFGRPPEVVASTVLVNFWHVPRDGADILPVVFWRRDPNYYTHRYEWMFPAGTVLGEMMFLVAGEEWFPFEIRTRTRALTGWQNDIFRPFPTAGELADALELKRKERSEWQNDNDISALIDHLRSPSTLVAATLEASHFAAAFPALAGAKDVLPALADSSILEELLLTTPFRSAAGEVWKQQGNLVAYAPTTSAAFSIVPTNYDAGFLSVDDATCHRCHQDAGRPFRDFYDNILAYGELWGEDEAFSWHPFDSSIYVDAKGDVKNFNFGSRVLRADFTQAGLLEKYDAGLHPETRWKKLPGAWKNYKY